MPDIGTAVAYLVATVELAQVRSVRNATRANLLEAGGVEGPLGTIRNPRRVDLTRRPDPDLPVRPPCVVAIHPPAAGAPRHDCACPPIVVEVRAVTAIDATFEVACEPRPHVGSKAGPLVPPWRLPLVPDEACGPAVIKCPPPPPDVIGKGQLLDFFM